MSEDSGGAPFVTTDPTPPVIDVWYGDTQRFGHLGNPQPWVNILGNVASAAGMASLTFSLNGGPARSLSLGCDLYRLARPGDFNIDIHIQELHKGMNEVRIIAVDSSRQTASRTVHVEYTPGRT